MRILFILEYFHPHIGGVEKLFSLLAERLVESGHEVQVITNKYDKDLKGSENLNGVKIYRYRFYNRYLFTFLAWIPALLKARNCDIIHTTTYNAALPAWFVSKCLGKKSVLTFHELWGDLWFELPWMSRPIKHLHYLFEKMLCSLYFDRVIAVSQFTKEALIQSGMDGSRVRRIYNGIQYSKELPQYQSKNQSKNAFTFFGRTGHSKGIDILLGGAGLLKMKNSDFHLNLVLSKDPKRLVDEVLGMISGYDLTKNVSVFYDLEWNDLVKLIMGGRAVVIPSYSEGFCFAAVESMSMAIPLVTSGRGALGEVVTGKHITMSEFTAEGLSEALELAINDKWQEKPVVQFPLESTINQYLEEYNRLMDQ